MNKAPFVVYFKSSKAPSRYLLKSGVFNGELTLNEQLQSNPSLMGDFPGVSSLFDITNIRDLRKLQKWVNKNKSIFGVKSNGTPDISAVIGWYIKYLMTLGSYSSTIPGSVSSSIVKVASTHGPYNEIVQLLLDNKNLILQGAPGVGKTYITRKIAVSLCEGLDELHFNAKYRNRADLIKGYNKLVAAKRIGFITFHQSLDYEEFVEGLKPDIDEATNKGTGTFSVKPGLFKKICDEAKDKQEPYVLIIDEINRANISKVLGELITLIEPSKRCGGDDSYSVTLPYSQEEFSVPSNLYIIGTMNTADRSLGSLDYAIRRRFAFKTLVSDNRLVTDPRAIKYFEAIKDLITIAKDDDFETDDIMIGHSYFMGDFENNLNNKIIPLLLEYFRDGVLVYEKVISSDHSSVFSGTTGKSKSDNLKDYLDEKAK